MLYSKTSPSNPAYGEALTAPTYYILSRRENYVWGLAITYGKNLIYEYEI